MPILDAVASIVIGLILAVTAALLAYETKGLLIGEAAAPDVVSGVRGIVLARQGILAINEMATLHFGPEDVLLTLSVDFADGFSSVGVEREISEMEQAIKESYPEITRVFIEAQSIAGHHRDRSRTDSDAEQ